MAVVKNEMQQRDQGQTIDCIIFTLGIPTEDFVSITNSENKVRSTVRAGVPDPTKSRIIVLRRHWPTWAITQSSVHPLRASIRQAPRNKEKPTGWVGFSLRNAL